MPRNWNNFGSYGKGAQLYDNPVQGILDRRLAGTQPTGQPGQSGAGDFSSMQRWMGGTNDAGAQTQGILPTGMGMATGALQGYLGMKQYGLAKDTHKQNKKEFNLNYDAQQQQTNRELRERQQWRNRNTDHAQSVDSYMDKNRVRDR